MKRVFRSGRAMLMLAAVVLATLAAARPAAAQVTYTYQGNGFTFFKCVPVIDPDDPSSYCGTPGQFTSYRTTNFITVVMTLNDPLPADMPFQAGVELLPGFNVTISDGIHRLVYPGSVFDPLTADVYSLAVSTDSSGHIVKWQMELASTTLGIWLQSYYDGGSPPFDQAYTYDATIGGILDAAFNYGPAGTWTFSGHKDTPATMVQNLINLLPTFGLTQGQVNSFTTKLTNVLTSIQQGDNQQAINQLNAFINQVQAAVSNGKISAATGAALIAAANAIIQALQAS